MKSYFKTSVNTLYYS